VEVALIRTILNEAMKKRVMFYIAYKTQHIKKNLLNYKQRNCNSATQVTEGIFGHGTPYANHP
jgi:hypothetical protein